MKSRCMIGVNSWLTCTIEKLKGGVPKFYPTLRLWRIVKHGKNLMPQLHRIPFCLNLCCCRIMERAYALRDAREKERARFVKEKYNEQWRDACDDARTLDSKAMTKAMHKDRIAQIEDKIRRKQQVSSQENSFLDEWNRQLEQLEKRDLDKQQLRRRVDHETSNEIKAQV